MSFHSRMTRVWCLEEIGDSGTKCRSAGRYPRSPRLRDTRADRTSPRLCPAVAGHRGTLDLGCDVRPDSFRETPMVGRGPGRYHCDRQFMGTFHCDAQSNSCLETPKRRRQDAQS